MACCGRRIKARNVSADHCAICFKPQGIPKNQLEVMVLFEDEMEAIRLADFESLYQQECAQKMQISRTTFSRLVVSARKKIADALLHHKALEVQPR